MGIIGSKESRIIAKNKVEPGTVMDSRFKAVISIVLLAETYGTDQLIMVSLEEKRWAVY